MVRKSMLEFLLISSILLETIALENTTMLYVIKTQNKNVNIEGFK